MCVFLFVCLERNKEKVFFCKPSAILQQVKIVQSFSNFPDINFNINIDLHSVNFSSWEFNLEVSLLGCPLLGGLVTALSLCFPLENNIYRCKMMDTK